jgi:ribose transport system substrate-binding protein
MKKSLCFLGVFILIFSLINGCGGSKEKDKASDTGQKYKIGVIPKGTTHEFWKSIHAGAIKASRELGIEIVWKGPLREDDREEQVQVVETLISAKVDALVLAPLDDRALVMPVSEAKVQGIPTVIIDSDLQEGFHVSFVATDNYKGGVLAAERMGELTGGKGKLIVLRYQEGSASTIAREAGFLDTIKSKFSGLEILSDNQYAGATTESAYRASENLLNRFSEVTAFFAPNESSTFGTLRALQDSGRAGKIVFIGFDSSEKLIEALSKGEIQGLVLQNPFKMGYLGVKTAYSYLKGETIEKRIDTGVVVATPENMNNPEIKELLSPDLSQYLNKE